MLSSQRRGSACSLRFRCVLRGPAVAATRCRSSVAGVAAHRHALACARCRPQILNVAFCAAYNAPRYYQELRDRSVKKVRCAWLGLWGPRMTPLVTYIAALTPSVPWLPRACRLAGAAQFAWVVITALTFCFLVYGSMAITGCAPLPCLARPTLSRIVSCRCCGLRCGVGPRYLTFGKNTNSDLLTNYGTDITIVLITRFVLTFVVIFT